MRFGTAHSDMILFLSAAFLLVRKSASADAHRELTGWYQAPNFRGTWDLIVSCVLTLTICVWSALHLNVPCEDSRMADRARRRLRWILLGIFIPELVVATAFGQYLAARWLMREIENDVKHRETNVHPRRHCCNATANICRGLIRAGVGSSSFGDGPSPNVTLP